jgi:hypothetical protein
VLQFAGAILAGLLAWGLAPPLTQWQANGNFGPTSNNSTAHQITVRARVSVWSLCL